MMQGDNPNVLSYAEGAAKEVSDLISHKNDKDKAHFNWLSEIEETVRKDLESNFGLHLLPKTPSEKKGRQPRRPKVCKTSEAGPSASSKTTRRNLTADLSSISVADQSATGEKRLTRSTRSKVRVNDTCDGFKKPAAPQTHTDVSMSDTRKRSLEDGQSEPAAVVEKQSRVAVSKEEEMEDEETDDVPEMEKSVLGPSEDRVYRLHDRSNRRSSNRQRQSSTRRPSSQMNTKAALMLKDMGAKKVKVQSMVPPDPTNDVITVKARSPTKAVRNASPAKSFAPQASPHFSPIKGGLKASQGSPSTKHSTPKSPVRAIRKTRSRVAASPSPSKVHSAMKGESPVSILKTNMTPAKLHAKVHSFLSRNTPKKTSHKEVESAAREKLRVQEEREAEAKVRKDKTVQEKAEVARKKREERAKRVAEVKAKQELKETEKRRQQEDKHARIVGQSSQSNKPLAPIKAIVDLDDSTRSENEARERKHEIMRMQREKEELERLRQKEVTQLENIRLEKERQRKIVLQQEKDKNTKLQHDKQLKAVIKKQNVSLETASQPPTLKDSTFHVNNTESYNMTPLRKIKPATAENYNIDDIRSSDETDNEEEPRKEIPMWAQGSSLRTALVQQYYRPPDLNAMFGVVIMPDLTKIFTHQRKRFQQRTSSAHWNSPILPLNS